MAETTIDEVGLGTIAKYRLKSSIGSGENAINLRDTDKVTGWEFKVTGDSGVYTITNNSDNVLMDKEDSEAYIVFIDTNETGAGTLKGRVRMEIEDTDYIKPNSNIEDDDRNIRPEVSLAFDVLKVS